MLPLLYSHCCHHCDDEAEGSVVQTWIFQMKQLLEKLVFSWQCLQASLHVDCCDRNQGGTCKKIRKVMKGRTYGSVGKTKTILSQQCLQASLHGECCGRNHGGTCKKIRNIIMGRIYDS
jgi:hypothetical protein